MSAWTPAQIATLQLRLVLAEAAAAVKEIAGEIALPDKSDLSDQASGARVDFFEQVLRAARHLLFQDLDGARKVLRNGLGSSPLDVQADDDLKDDGRGINLLLPRGTVEAPTVPLVHIEPGDGLEALELAQIVTGALAPRPAESKDRVVVPFPSRSSQSFTPPKGGAA